ncbi:tRNA-ribosyltransferase family protein [Aspergillus homomorphus CBS 101889]|uniref:Queuine tRNA-ribosyltransferase accessory subunit 2 n=1 Tax=Aspergillus homomorphus (strain CBS 101889) TaxID=1450537 RepID=A0A395HMS8_ASPHC|nr:tRNA-guanine transglycosylase family protein [Aspergillus homomorphus CBS 101889]RAL09147.1 tRNA-guanine transglycosylase family protein [Aspergillus homomorphus CBS 101889]
MGSESSPQSPQEMLKFTSTASILTPRLGRLAVAGRKPISTPHYIPLTSRGVVPHITQDVMRDQTAIGSVFVGLEDFLERQTAKNPFPPAYKVPTAANESALRNFICLPDDLLLIMGPRREPPIKCPPSNTPNSIAILTSVGYRQLEASHYIEAIRHLRPDIIIGLADLVRGHNPGLKRRGKMVDRTHAYTTHATEQLYKSKDTSQQQGAATTTTTTTTTTPPTTTTNAVYFAPVLPLENAEQSIYLEDLESELRPYISGLALYESASLSAVSEPLGDLPRLLFSAPATPHEVLRDVSLGADLHTIPFMGICSDAGIALNFTFFPPPPPQPQEQQEEQTSTPAPSQNQDQGQAQAQLALAYDLWSPEHKTDTRPLSENCECYTCRNHHRAYLHHLLSAKEMLAWSLLQIHNHHTMDVFFAQIRQSIDRATFDADTQAFSRRYVSELPEPKGQGPRLRGYQLPASGPNQPRRHARVYGRLDDAAEKFAESQQSSVATPDTGADGLEEHGFAKKV